MKLISAIFLILATSMQTQTLFDFTTQQNIDNWHLVDDGVMGGRSKGGLYTNDDGHGVFKGNVSLENNGGFSSLRHQFKTIKMEGFTKCVITLKGDGNQYQFRVKTNSSDYYSYINYFTTAKDQWQTIEINLKDLYPTFRGRKLDQPKHPIESLEEIGFLIGNKKAQEFCLLIDKIELK